MLAVVLMEPSSRGGMWNASTRSLRRPEMMVMLMAKPTT